MAPVDENIAPQGCTWLFGCGASIANGLSWVVPEEWKRDLIGGQVTREEHICIIKNAIREIMENIPVPCDPYRRILDCMNERTVDEGYHHLFTTNWDYLLQREVDAWVNDNRPGWQPPFLSDSWVYHLNGSVEEGDFQNRSPFMLETDSAYDRTRSYEANQAFNRLLWSTLVIIVGMSFECDTDRGLMGALKNHEDNCPIGNAGFIVVDPCREALDKTFGMLAECFPRAVGCRINKGLSEWIDDGMTDLVGSIFDP